jgi:hypothetical protein
MFRPGAAALTSAAATEWHRRRSAGAMARLEIAGAPEALASLQDAWRLDLRGTAAPDRLLRELADGRCHAAPADEDPGSSQRNSESAAPRSGPGRRGDAYVPSGPSPPRRGRRMLVPRVGASRPRGPAPADVPDPPPSPAGSPDGVPTFERERDRPAAPEPSGRMFDPLPGPDDPPSAPHEDDFALTDRIARILAEEARRHGIDV